MTAQEHNTTPRQGYDFIKSLLLGLIILAAGIAIGASLTFLRMSHPADRYGQEPEIFAEQMLGRLGRELNLSPRQRQQLDPILVNYHKTLSDIRQAARPQIVAQLEEMNKDILSVLDDAQKQIWQRKVQRIEEQFPTFRHRGPGQGFGPQPERSPSMGPGPEQDFPPDTPRGPRQPRGPGLRRQGRFDPPDTNEPLLPPPAPPEF